MPSHANRTAVAAPSDEVAALREEVEALRRQLVELQRVSALGVLAGSVCHELNNALMPVLKSVKLPMSIGHFAYQPATAGVNAPGFQALLALMRDGNTWM